MTLRRPVGIVAELVSLLKTITADGQMTGERIAQVDAWLAAHPDCSLPPLELLRATSVAIRANGSVSREEHKAFHKAVEQILPPEDRRHSKTVRKARELADQAKQKKERVMEQSIKRAAKEKARADAAAARERNRVVYRSNFLASGTSYNNRCSAIRSHLKEDQAVVLMREPHNEYDRYAIKIFAQSSGGLADVGYVPREITPTLAPLMDRPHKYIATCTKILENDRLIPVIDLVLYGPDADLGQPKFELSKPVIPTWTWAAMGATAQLKIQTQPSPSRQINGPSPHAQYQRQQHKVNVKRILLWVVVTVLIVILGFALR